MGGRLGRRQAAQMPQQEFQQQPRRTPRMRPPPQQMAPPQQSAGMSQRDMENYALQYLYSQNHTYPGYLTTAEAYMYSSWLYSNYGNSNSPDPALVASIVASRPGGIVSYQEFVQQLGPYYAHVAQYF